MRRIAFILIIIIGTRLSFASEMIVRKISFSEGKIPGQIHLATKVGGLFHPDSLAIDSSRMAKYYQQQAWFDCQIPISTNYSGNDVDINIGINKGNRYSLKPNSVSVMKNDSLLTAATNILDQYKGQPATSENIENLMCEIIALYAENGYPYCDTKATNLNKADSAYLKLTIEIQPGPRVQIERLEFPGRKNIEQKYLAQYCGLDIPFTYSTSKLDLAARRLSLSRFLTETGGYELKYINIPDRGAVYFPIKEMPSLALDGGLGFASKGNSFYGRINATISNILGKGRQAEFYWSKKDKSSRIVKLGFFEPYVFGQPFQLDISASQEDRDSLYIESRGSLGLSYSASNTYVYGVSAGASQLSPEPYGKTIMSSKNRYWVAINFSVDNRDYPINPRNGEFYYLEGNFVTENIRGDSEFAAVSDNYQTVKLTIQKSLPLSKSSSLYAGFSAQGDFSNEVPIDRQFTLGGFGSLRGYSQDFFYVSKDAIFTVEYRLLTSRDGRAYIFNDMATFKMGNSSSGGSKAKFKDGFGFGLAASVQFGLATIEFAVPSDEGFGAAKIHFGIKAGF